MITLIVRLVGFMISHVIVLGLLIGGAVALVVGDVVPEKAWKAPLRDVLGPAVAGLTESSAPTPVRRVPAVPPENGLPEITVLERPEPKPVPMPGSNAGVSSPPPIVPGVRAPVLTPNPPQSRGRILNDLLQVIRELGQIGAAPGGQAAGR